jgi:HTH-type transcriptional regulator/antitoxin HigA
VAEVLNRRRSLALPMIRRLNRLLDIPADVLIQPYKTKG